MATLSRLLATIMAGTGVVWAAATPAHADGSVEAAVKATYIVKFTHYVTWPPAALGAGSAPLVVCVVGKDPFGATIDAAASGERVDAHPVVVRRMTTVDRGSGCNVAFLGGDIAARALPALDGSPVLTITDAGETHARGMFHFQMRGGHVGFDVDDRKATRGGLEISSRLLSIAWSVASREARR